MREVRTPLYRFMDVGDNHNFGEEKAGYLFKNPSRRFNPIFRVSDADFKTFSTDVKLVARAKTESELTLLLRRGDAQIARATELKSRTPAMSPKEDGFAFMCGLGAKYDFLTYHDRVWHEFIELFRRALMDDGVLDETNADGPLMWLTDYSLPQPAYNLIRYTPSMCYQEEYRDHALMSAYRNSFGAYQLKCLSEEASSPTPSFKVPINRYKSAGPDNVFPDGRFFHRKDAFINAAGAVVGPDAPGARFSTYDLKQAWATSGALLEIVSGQLENEERLARDPASIVDRVIRRFFPTCTTAYRSNNGDPILYERAPEKMVASCYSGELKTKNREWATINADGTAWREGYFDFPKLRAFYDAKVPPLLFEKHAVGQSQVAPHVLIPAKVRPINPNGTATIGPYWTAFSHALTHRLEAGPAGIPSLRDCVLKRYQAFKDLYGQNGLNWVFLDRSHSETWNASNWPYVLEAYPRSLGKMIHNESLIARQSETGWVVGVGGIFSGDGLTSFKNMNPGALSMLRVLGLMTGLSAADVCKKISSDVIAQSERYHATGEVLREFPEFPVVGHVCFNIGRDDMVLGFEKPLGDAQKKQIEDWCAKRSLGAAWAGVTDHSQEKCFGLTFSEQGVEFKQSSLLDKLMLVEKSTVGDEWALKYTMRRTLMPEIAGPQDYAMSKLDLGEGSSWQQGAVKRLEFLARFGFHLEDIFNVYSPSEKALLDSLVDEWSHSVVYSGVLEKLSMTMSDNYDDGVVMSWIRDISQRCQEDLTDLAQGKDLTFYQPQLLAE